MLKREALGTSKSEMAGSTLKRETETRATTGSVKTQIRLLAETLETWSLLGHGTWPQLMCCALVAVRVPEVGRGRVGVSEQGGSSDNDQDK